MEFLFQLVNGGPFHLYATKGQGRALGRVCRQPGVELGPAHRVLAQKLDPLRTPGVAVGELLHSLGDHGFAEALPRRQHPFPVAGVAARARRSHDQCPAHLRMGDGEAKGQRTAHGEPAYVGLLDVQVLQETAQVFHLVLLGICVRVSGHLRRRVAAVAESDHLVTAGEEVHLGLPTGDVPGEFVTPDQGITFASHFVVDLNSVRVK